MNDRENGAGKLSLGLAVLALLAVGGSAGAADDAVQDFRSLFVAARKAVAGGNVTTTRLAGVDVSRTTFRETPDEGAVLIGFEVGLDKFLDDDVIRALRPIFLKQSGEFTSGYLGAVNKQGPGNKPGKDKKVTRWVTVKAEFGYAVGSVQLRTGLNIHGLSLTYMRLAGSTLDPAKTYTSEWVGTGGHGSKFTLSGDGAPIVGVCGNHDDEKVRALGLICLAPPPRSVAPPPAATSPSKPATPPGDSATAAAGSGHSAAAADPPAVQFETYNDPEKHYSFIMPKGWQRMTSKEMEQLDEYLKSNWLGSLVHYDGGIRRRYGSSWSYPYVLIQTQPVPSTGMTYDEIERGLSWELPATVKLVSASLGDWSKNTELGSAVLDRDRNLIVMRMAMDVGGMGKVQGLSVGHIGKEHIVSLHSYALDKDFDRYLKVFTEMNNSFAFDEGLEFKPAPAVNLNLPGGVLPVLVGVGCTGLVIAALFYFQKGRTASEVKISGKLDERFQWKPADEA
jgi:hypothetical protein